MSKKVVVLSTSLRSSSNSELLAKSFVEGARDTGNEVEYISLKNKDIRFCIGCLACQKTGHCVIKDDVADIMNSVLKADVVVWATPIYYYEMSGQMKTLIDRLNPMYLKTISLEMYIFLRQLQKKEMKSLKKLLLDLVAGLIVLKRHLLKALYFVVVYLVVEIYLVILNLKKPTI